MAAEEVGLPRLSHQALLVLLPRFMHTQPHWTRLSVPHGFAVEGSYRLGLASGRGDPDFRRRAELFLTHRSRSQRDSRAGCDFFLRASRSTWKYSASSWRADDLAGFHNVDCC